MSTDQITLHVISDSLGETGEMVARAVASQFDEDGFRIERLPRVTSPEQLSELVTMHCGRTCIFLYTIVDRELRSEMARIREECQVHAVDLLGPAVDLIQQVTGYEAVGEAGVIRRTDAEYFDRIEAMEFTVKHDDGRNPEGLLEADIVLIGVSRTSKTPLSMYLALKGFRVANIPLAPGSAPPPELFEADPRKVFGLVTDPALLIEIRQQRIREMGGWVPHYAEREDVEHELEDARGLMRRIGCIVVHTDNRAIEEAAQEIIRRVEGSHRTRD